MSHEITQRDLQVGLEVAWHGLTTVVDKITRENCGICYEMQEVPLFYQNGVDDKGVPLYRESGSKQIISLDDNLPIGPSVNNTYKMIPNIKIWELMENSLANVKHEIVSVGTVKAREIGFISVKVSDDFEAAGRLTQSNLNFLWGHSGKMALIAKTGLTTVVCNNTVMMSLSEHSDFKLSVKHTKNSAAEISNLEKAIDAHLKACENYTKLMDEFANIKITLNQAEKLFAGYLAKKGEAGDAKELSTRTRNTVDRLTQLFKGGAGNNGDDLADAVNAVTDFYTHESSGGNNKWKQFESSEFGSGNNVKIDFINVIRNEEKRKELIKRGDSVLSI